MLGEKSEWLVDVFYLSSAVKEEWAVRIKVKCVVEYLAVFSL